MTNVILLKLLLEDNPFFYFRLNFVFNSTGVITAADNIKYPAINAFVRVFQQDQDRHISNQESWSEIAIKNHYIGHLHLNKWLALPQF